MYNIGASSGTLPIVFNFTANNSNHTSSGGVANFLSNFKVTTNGNTDISTVEDAIIVTGNGGTQVYGDGKIVDLMVLLSLQELVALASLNSYDNDTMAASNVALEHCIIQKK